MRTKRCPGPAQPGRPLLRNPPEQATASFFSQRTAPSTRAARSLLARSRDNLAMRCDHGFARAAKEGARERCHLGCLIWQQRVGDARMRLNKPQRRQRHEYAWSLTQTLAEDF